MNEPSKKMKLYVLGGFAVLCLFILLGWFAFHEEPPPPNQHRAKAEPAKPQARQVAPAFKPVDDVSNETPTNQPDASASTNAAVIYRQAFDLFNALSKEQKLIVSDWRTNVDASVEAELCVKTAPICDLMRQASAVTNCDWGIDPITFDTKLPHLAASRSLARAAIWNAAHCRSNDVAGATDDAVSALQLGQRVSRSLLIGNFVDIAVQNIASSYVAQNLGLFRGVDGQRLTAAFEDPSYEETPSRVMEKEADMVERRAAHLASLPTDQAEKEVSELAGSFDGIPFVRDRAVALAALKQIADSERELAKALASSSEDKYQAWQQHSAELQAATPLASLFLPVYDLFVERTRCAEVNRAMVVAGLAVAENRMEALEAHPDPASGKPFQYTKTDDGFELQSTLEVNGTPYKIRFK